MSSGISYIINPDGTPGESWSPFSGCNGPVGTDGKQHRCVYCYSILGQRRWGNSFDPTFHEGRLKQPSHWAKPRTVALCFQGDLFDPANPVEQISEVMRVVRTESRHHFLITTKQAWRMLQVWDFGDGVRTGWGGKNLWLGVTVTCPEDAWRLDALEQLAARAGVHTWVSFEPLVGPVGALFPLKFRPDCVVVGGMSGPDARTHALPLGWVRDVRDACEEQQIPFVFKQFGHWVPALWKSEATHGVALADGGVVRPILKSEPGSPERPAVAALGWQGVRWQDEVQAFPVLDGRRHAYLPWAGREAP